jgi:hypothetical protein
MEKEPDISPDKLLRLVEKVKEHYQPQAEPCKRGKKRVFSGLSFLLLTVAAVVMRTFKEAELHQLLSRDERLRTAMGFVRVPHRTTMMRRLKGLVPEAEAQIAALGEVIVEEVEPEAEQSPVSAIDGRLYKAAGPLWHKKDREAGIIPAGLRNVATESRWSKSGYRGWVQGYRLVLQGLAFPAPVPIFAAWRPNNENEAKIAMEALETGALKVIDVLLGDETFGQGDFPQLYAEAGGWVLAPQQLPAERRSWKDDLYDYRKETIELLFQRIIQASGLKECQGKGNGRNGAFVLISGWLYQLIFLDNYRQGVPPCDIKPILDDARWRIPD